MLDQDFGNKQEEGRGGPRVPRSADCGNTGKTNQINFYQSNVGEATTTHKLETASSATTDCIPNPLQQMEDDKMIEKSQDHGISNLIDRSSER